MAELLNVKRTSYRNWEENTEPSLTIIKSIAIALEMPAWKLLEGIIDYHDSPEKEKSGSFEPDINLIAKIKEQVLELKINFDTLFEPLMEQSKETSNLGYPNVNLIEGTRRKAGKQ